MSTDIHTMIAALGPHAIAHYRSQEQALKAYGIDPSALIDISKDTRALVIEEHGTK